MRNLCLCGTAAKDLLLSVDITVFLLVYMSFLPKERPPEARTRPAGRDPPESELQRTNTHLLPDATEIKIFCYDECQRGQFLLGAIDKPEGERAACAHYHA